MTILAIGAAGKYAGLVVPELAKRGAHVRGLIRSADQADKVKKSGAAEVALGDLRDTASLDTALKGVQAVFYVGPVFFPDEAKVGTGLVEAAIRAGVQRFVFSGVIHPVLTSLVNHRAKIAVEEAVLNSDLEFTFLHPTFLFQNYAQFWPAVTKDGVLAEPWSADTRFSRVDYRDVAEVAAIALTEEKLLYGTFELCSPGVLNRWDVAALISKVLGREIKVKSGDPDSLGTIPAAMKAMFEHYEHHGLLGNPLALTTILGRQPRSLENYFEELDRKTA